MNPHFFLVVFAGYFVSLIFYFIHFEKPRAVFAGFAEGVLALSLGIHAAVVVYFLFMKRTFFPGNFPETVFMVSFLAVLVPFLIEKRYRARYLLLFSLPPVLFLSLLAMMMAHQANLPAGETKNAWLWLHLGFIFSGFAGLVTAAGAAAMYLIQASQLKSRKPGLAFLRLPSLETLDTMHFWTLVWGSILFSMGILSGLLWAERFEDYSSVWKDPKVIISFLACPLYWAVLAMRLSSLRRGQKIAYGTLLIFIVFFVLLVGSYYCPVGFHQRGF